MSATLDWKKFNTKKRERFKRVIVIALLTVPLNLYFAYFFYQTVNKIFAISKGKIDGFQYDLSPINVFQTYVTDNRIWLIFILLQVATLIYILLLLLTPTATLVSVKEVKITEDISIPIAVGSGQYGNARFATEKEKKALTGVITIGSDDIDKEIEESPNIVIEMKSINGIDHISYFKNFSHSIILALTGAGKTRRVLLESICLQIMAGDCIFVSDIKGEIFYYTSEFAKSRGYKIITLDLNNPLKSDHYNFLQPVLDELEKGKKQHDKKVKEYKKIFDDPEQIRKRMMSDNDFEKIEEEYANIKNDYAWTGQAQEYAWDLVSVLVGEQKGEPIWYNGESASICAAILIVCMEAPKEFRNMTNVYAFISYMTKSIEVLNTTLLEIYLDELPDTHPAKFIFRQSQIAPYRTRTSFYTSALGTLRLFTNPRIATMMSKSDFNLGSIGMEGKTILYMIIPDEKKTYHSIASLLINQMYIAQVESARSNGGRLKIPMKYALDEVGNFPYIPVMPSLISVGRSRGITANLIFQDYQQGEKIYKEDFETIKSQCGLKIFLKSDSVKTLEEISKKLGDYTTENVSASVSSNTNLRDLNSNVSNSSNLTGRKLLDTADLMKFKSPHALVMATGENPMVTELPDLSEYHFNNFLGLGDEEHNSQKIVEIENKRKEIEQSSVQLWGIWNEVQKKADKMVADLIAAMKEKKS